MAGCAASSFPWTRRELSGPRAAATARSAAERWCSGGRSGVRASMAPPGCVTTEATLAGSKAPVQLEAEDLRGMLRQGVCPPWVIEIAGEPGALVEGDLPGEHAADAYHPRSRGPLQGWHGQPQKLHMRQHIASTGRFHIERTRGEVGRCSDHPRIHHEPIDRTPCSDLSPCSPDRSDVGEIER